MQEAELQRLTKAREQELTYKQQMDNLEVEKQKRLARIESERFGQLVQSLGSDTLKEMARAGPETQVTAVSSDWHSRLLSSLLGFINLELKLDYSLVFPVIGPKRSF